MLIRHLIAAICLGFGAPAPATAVPVFDDALINAELQRFDVAGIHFGDTVEQVRTKLANAGWSQRRLDMNGETFADAVGRAVSAKTGRAFTPSGKLVPHMDEFWKGAQTLEIEYRQHPLGTLVYKVIYQHQGVTTPEAFREFLDRADAKYSQTPLIKIGPELRCLAMDRLCRRSVENGRVVSDLPSVRTLELNGGLVILEGGEAAERIFGGAVAKAVNASGSLAVEF